MGKSSSPKTVEPPKTYVQATAPEPEETAEAPTVSTTAQSTTERSKKKTGTAALKINLNIGGTSGSSVNIPN